MTNDLSMNEELLQWMRYAEALGALWAFPRNEPKILDPKGHFLLCIQACDLSSPSLRYGSERTLEASSKLWPHEEESPTGYPLPPFGAPSCLAALAVLGQSTAKGLFRVAMHKSKPFEPEALEQSWSKIPLAVERISAMVAWLRDNQGETFFERIVVEATGEVKQLFGPAIGAMSVLVPRESEVDKSKLPQKWAREWSWEIKEYRSMVYLILECLYKQGPLTQVQIVKAINAMEAEYISKDMVWKYLKSMVPLEMVAHKRKYSLTSLGSLLYGEWEWKQWGKPL